MTLSQVVQLALLLLIINITALQGETQPKAVDWSNTVGEKASDARAEWRRLTQGEELAAGKRVQFFPNPNYGRTTDENDAFDLTDGQLSSREDDRIWFNKDAVGWYLNAGGSTGILMVVDLGGVQPVGQIAIRLLGGREQGSLELPAALEFLASTNGTDYHSLQRMSKLMPEEKGLSDFKTAFYLPEEGKAFMHGFGCREAVRARYIAIRATPQTGVFTDQISVLKATDEKTVKPIENYPVARVFTSGLAAFPKSEPLAVSTNIVTPNWLTVQDYVEDKAAKRGLRIEVPAGLRLVPGSLAGGEWQESTSSQPGTRAYEVTKLLTGARGIESLQGPFYFERVPGTQASTAAEMTLTGLLDGKPSHSLKYPLNLVQIPEVPPLKSLDVSLAWTRDAEQQAWPGYLDNFHKLGFNFVSTFPRDFKKLGDDWTPDTKKFLARLDEARSRGYRVVYNESAFHIMEKNVVAAQKAGKISPEEAVQIFNQVDGKPGKFISPLYRGPYFQAEINRVADFVKLVRPDHVYQDIEWWHECFQESRRDPRMQEAWKASGKSWEEFTTDMGTEILRTLGQAMRAASPNPNFKWGLYGAEAGRPPVQAIFQWNKIYPGIVDFAQPSLYVQGRAADVATRIRTDYESQKNRDIIPWLTAGTYGEFAPEKMEPMILEAVLNGSKGVTYYAFRDFDPMDFYYHAKALQTLAKYEDLVQSGKPTAYTGDNPNLHYTFYSSGKEALLLVGNYSNTTRTSTRLAAGFKTAELVDGTKLTVTRGSIDLVVPPGTFKLVHLH